MFEEAEYDLRCSHASLISAGFTYDISIKSQTYVRFEDHMKRFRDRDSSISISFYNTPVQIS